MRRTVSIMMVILAVTAISAIAAPSIKLSGYVQARYTDVIGDKDANKVSGFEENGTFYIRRARIAAKATVTEQAVAVIEIDASNVGVSTKKAYVGYTAGDVYFVAGRDTVPFGYELQLSSSALTTLERSMISNAFPEYVTGLVVRPIGKTVPVKAKLGIVNGDDPDGKTFSDKYTDKNNNKVVMLNVEKQLDKVLVGGSYVTNSNSDDAVNGYIAYCGDKLYLAAEYIATDFDVRLIPMATQNDGYYLLGAYSVAPMTNVYARYDTFDNATIEERSRITLGVNHFLDPAQLTKLTAEYQIIDDPAVPELDGAFGVQLQAKF